MSERLKESLKKALSQFLFASVLSGAFIAAPVQAKNHASTEPKDWTLLVFLNGHNNLDSYGYKDINEMEKVGSTDHVNVVVQFASQSAEKTQRLFVTRDDDTSKINSLVVEEMPKVDMGDYKNLVDFIRWGAEKFPAQHYMVDVWNHGSGWHRIKLKGGAPFTPPFSTNDISFDDNTGHSITTEQLGAAMEEASNAIGQKIDIYGSDACLMAMAEVASEMAKSVKVFVGSQELEPGDGWAYDTFLSELAANPTATPQEVGKMLTETYINSYAAGGSQSNGYENDVTFSTLDLEALPALEKALGRLASEIQKMNPLAIKKLLAAVKKSMNFYYSDYVDLGDFLTNSREERTLPLDESVFSSADSALKRFVVITKNSSRYAKASGVSIWIPKSFSSYQSYAERYSKLKFNQNTSWGSGLASLLKSQ